MKILKALIDSKLYLAFAAFLFCWQTQVQLGLHPRIHTYQFIVFFATLLVYNLPKMSVFFARASSLYRPRLHFYVLIISSLIGLALALVKAEEGVLLVALSLGVITLWYSFPLIKTKNKTIKLRTIPYAKIFIIALVWSSATVFIPFAHSSSPNGVLEVLCIFAERFFFIFAITIPFDTRDLELDQKSGLKTLPMLLDAQGTYLLSYGTLLIFMLFACVHYFIVPVLPLLMAQCLSGVLTFIFLSKAYFRKWPLYHNVLLDGSMLLQSFLVLAFYYAGRL